MDELEAWLKIVRVPGIRASQLLQLLQQFGSAIAFVQTSTANLLAAGLEQKTIDQLQLTHDEELKRALTWLEQPQHQLVTINSPQYPHLLARLADAPLALFVSGDVQCLNDPQLAMVGTRNPSATGRATAESFARHLVGCGLTITSGLAMGIDVASHQGALAGHGKTIAVFGTGLDIIYPASSVKLARSIEESGALVSEFPPGTPPRKAHFPQRNRIISGLALGTLVVEAALRSGSLITARLAGEQGREVFAIPGSIHNPMAKGCHQLIRQGAKLVDAAADILSELGPLTAAWREPTGPVVTQSPPSLTPTLDKDYKMLLDALGFEPAGVDLLALRTGLKADEVASMLLILELEGHIESSPGGLYERAQTEGRDNEGKRF